MTDATIRTFDIRLEHPNLDGPLDMEVNATSERAAILRCRHGAMHLYREVGFINEEVTTATVLNVRPFVLGERGATSSAKPPNFNDR
jgi:hypothetical protein